MKAIPKRSIAILSVLLCLFIAALLLTHYFYREGRFGGVFRFNPPNLSILTANGENYLDSPFSFDGKSVSLRLKNEENESYEVTLLSEGEILCETTLYPKEEKEVTLTPKTKLSLVVKGGTPTSWIFDETTLSAFSSDLAGDVCLDGVKFDSVHFCAPVRLFGSFDFTEISIETEEKGNIVVAPSMPTDGKIYVNSPNAKVFTEKVSLSKTTLDFHVKAQSYNGKHLSADSFPIEDFNALSRLFSETALPRLTENACLFPYFPSLKYIPQK